MADPTIDRDRIAYRPVEAADVLGVSRATIYKLIAEGAIPARRLATRTLILRSDLERFAASLPAYEPRGAA
mgnify:CR=1 FL=1